MKVILGKKFVQLFCPFSLDKLCEMWYNGKFGASRSWAPRSRVKQKVGVIAHSHPSTSVMVKYFRIFK